MLRKISYYIHQIPGERLFGFYRFLPIFFMLGAALEFTMIKWTPFNQNFYKTFQKREAHKRALNNLLELGELDGVDIKDL